MEISLIHPSRSRPQKSFSTITSWLNRCANPSGVEFLISLDADDSTLDEYKNLYGGLICNKLIIILNNKSAVEAINAAAKVSTARILMVVSDDTACPTSWDRKIIKYTEHKSDFVLKVQDGIQPRIITAPIMDRVYYQRDGFIYNPAYDHCFADREFTEVANKRKRVITKNIMFRHLHYSVLKNKKRDDQYARTDATFESGKKIFLQRQKMNFGL